jgi:hypothetical protein
MHLGRIRTPRSYSLNQATRIPPSTACWPRASRNKVFPVLEARGRPGSSPGDPFQGPQRLLGRGGLEDAAGSPDVEGLPGGLDIDLRSADPHVVTHG